MVFSQAVVEIDLVTKPFLDLLTQLRDGYLCSIAH